MTALIQIEDTLKKLHEKINILLEVNISLEKTKDIQEQLNIIAAKIIKEINDKCDFFKERKKYLTKNKEISEEQNQIIPYNPSNSPRYSWPNYRVGNPELGIGPKAQGAISFQIKET